MSHRPTKKAQFNLTSPSPIGNNGYHSPSLPMKLITIMMVLPIMGRYLPSVIAMYRPALYSNKHPSFEIGFQHFTTNHGCGAFLNNRGRRKLIHLSIIPFEFSTATKRIEGSDRVHYYTTLSQYISDSDTPSFTSHRDTTSTTDRKNSSENNGENSRKPPLPSPPPDPSTFPPWSFEPRDFFSFEIMYESKKSLARVGRITTVRRLNFLFFWCDLLYFAEQKWYKGNFRSALKRNIIKLTSFFFFCLHKQ